MARKLGRTTDTRLALLRNLTTDVLIHERIETTEQKAKELRTTVDKMITLGKRGDLHARKQAAAFMYKKRFKDNELIKAEPKKQEDKVGSELALDKLFDELAKRYETRQGGYTRIRKLGPRRGDGANMVLIELVEELETAE